MFRSRVYLYFSVNYSIIKGVTFVAAPLRGYTFGGANLRAITGEVLMKRVILLVCVLMCVVLTGCQKVEREETTEVIATVTDRSHTIAYTTLMPMRSGKVTTYMPQFHPATYYVAVSYEGISKTFNNQALYESVQVGDTVQVILYHGYDKDDNLIKETLMLPE